MVRQNRALRDRAAVSNEGIKVDAGVVSGLNMIAARLSPGAISERSSSHLPPREASLVAKPVMFPDRFVSDHRAINVDFINVSRMACFHGSPSGTVWETIPVGGFASQGGLMSYNNIDQSFSSASVLIP
jgi:hypothetical protein